MEKNQRAENQPPYSQTGREASLGKADLLLAAFCGIKFGTLKLQVPPSGSVYPYAFLPHVPLCLSIMLSKRLL